MLKKKLTRELKSSATKKVGKKKVVNIRHDKVFYSDGTHEAYDEDKHGKLTDIRK